MTAEPRKIEGGPWDGFEVISEYTDAQAVEDGELVDVSGTVPGGRGQRVTRHAWADLTRSPMPGLTDVTLLTSVWAAALAVPEDDGWHVLDTPKLGTFWLIPNEVGGLTLMRPEDY
ncbi:MAG TPA: hypothetical protein VGS01_09640 [Candidatus Limnocylindria bacterium]|jgi:hypothetical protein|nr:hypothetical protein [Candidatus Limnocylindria bacterium]